MSEVILAHHAGFCPGVRAATDRLADRMKRRCRGERLLTLGHLIHNEDYNRSLVEAGVNAVCAADLPAVAAEASAEQPTTVFIRAHGISREVRALLERLAAEHPYFAFADCTCPFVSKIHRIATEQNAMADERIFICIGSATHPEVEGFMS